MGREVVRVPANWEHPTRDCPHSPWMGGCEHARQNGGRCFKPMHMHRDFATEAREWLDAAIAWDNDATDDAVKHGDEHPFYWTWGGNSARPGRLSSYVDGTGDALPGLRDRQRGHAGYSALRDRRRTRRLSRRTRRLLGPV